ncbi:MAG TPA: hypothetical protein VFA77_02210 [Candidatus Eisenbacteria bacterium]|nr:hypothetical protein [Candidatus Eisenbacteria bacterium]
MKYLSTILIGVILTAWIFLGLKQLRSAIKEPGWRKLIRLLAATFICVGATGFFGTALIAIGGFKQLPSSFEWPIGRAEGVVLTKDSYFIVPHTPSGRVQIYDTNWKFLRGWNVDAGGGTFTLHITETNRIHVETARGHTHYVFDLSGKLLSSETYSLTAYLALPKEGHAYSVPTPIWLWVFTSPFYSWLAAAAGLGLVILDRTTKQKTDHV